MDADALIGIVLGNNYKLQKVIGQGEMGIVFLAQQLSPDRQVAVKILLPLLPLSSDQYTAFLRRFQSEIDAVSSLKHPHIIQIYEHGEYQDLIYLVMPYVDGGTLRNKMKREGPFPLSKALIYLEQIASALDFAHAQGIIHGNVQPANILMQRDGQLLLTDFGMVKMLYEMNLSDSFHIRARMPIETLDYMAPEQVIGDKIGIHVDLYSLGVVLYQMLTGTVPFQSSMVEQHQYTQPVAPRLLRPDIPVLAEQVILKALSTHPANRYARAGDFARAFRLALQTADVVQKSNTIFTPKASENTHRTDVIKKTSFTIPSMSGFWGPSISQVPIVPAKPLVVPKQEENTPPPPMSISWPSWRWPNTEETAASQPTFADSASLFLPAPSRQSTPPNGQHPVKLAVLKTNKPARKRRLLAFALLIVLLALLSGAFVYANGRTTRSDAKSVTGSGSHASVVHTPPNTPANSGSSPTTNYAGPGTRSFQVGTHPLLVIKGQGSDVTIHAGDTGMVVVTAKARGNNNNVGVLYNQANDGQGHDRISIATNPGYMNMDYDITAPGTTLIQVQVNGGSIAVDGVSGVMIDTGGGNLDIENVHGPVNVHTENGDITARALTGSMDIEVGNGGSIHASDVKGSMKAISHNGDVVVRQSVLNGASVLETNYGSVRFDGTIDAQGTYAMKTINGNINLTLPANTAFQLAATAGSGTIYNAFGSTIVGNGPRAQIMANITNGSVTLNKAA